MILFCFALIFVFGELCKVAWVNLTKPVKNMNVSYFTLKETRNYIMLKGKLSLFFVLLLFMTIKQYVRISPPNSHYRNATNCQASTIELPFAIFECSMHVD